MSSNHENPHRRGVLTLAAAGAAAATTLGAASANAAAAKSAVKRAARSGPLIVNALGGLENPNLALNRPDTQVAGLNAAGQLDLDERSFRDARASGVSAINITLGYVAGPEDPFEQSVREIARWDAMIRARPDDLLKVWTAGDILKAKAEGKVGLIYGFQNAVQVAKPERVDTFADLGVKVIQLTYNPANMLGDGSMAPENRGITPAGREVIERLNARKVMVDLSHSGEQTCLEAARVSKTPISINHTGCRALTDLPRNKTDAELRLVAERGGFVGIYFMPFLKLDGHPHAEDVVAHIEHAVKVCGEDHVGLGTDGGITSIDDIELYKTHLAKEVEERRKAGIGAAGERADTFTFVIDLRGVDQFHKLAGLLAARGWPQSRIEKILGRNFLRYASDVWG